MLFLFEGVPLPLGTWERLHYFIVAHDSAINRLRQIEFYVLLDEFPTVTETRKRFNICLLAKQKARMQCLPRSIKLVDYQ